MFLTPILVILSFRTSLTESFDLERIIQKGPLSKEVELRRPMGYSYWPRGMQSGPCILDLNKLRKANKIQNILSPILSNRIDSENDSPFTMRSILSDNTPTVSIHIKIPADINSLIQHGSVPLELRRKNFTDSNQKTDGKDPRKYQKINNATEVRENIERDKSPTTVNLLDSTLFFMTEINANFPKSIETITEATRKVVYQTIKDLGLQTILKEEIPKGESFATISHINLPLDPTERLMSYWKPEVVKVHIPFNNEWKKRFNSSQPISQGKQLATTMVVSPPTHEGHTTISKRH